jgi:alkanesulfonate monooxygenase SsuD/methylene tetrahydromethanopterin reductase-like flavin-dependent oxidoreductase (luciferase family)
MLRLSGEVGDGLCGHPVASVRFMTETVWPTVDEGLRRSGRTRAEFNHCAWITTAIAQDKASALRELKLQVGYYLATRSYAIILDLQGLTTAREAIQAAYFQYPGNEDRLADAVPDDLALSHGICGSPDDVRQQAARYAEIANTSIFYPATRGMTSERRNENIRLVIETFST